jgi:predicted phosphodiesterase
MGGQVEACKYGGMTYFRILWLADIHFEFVRESEIEKFMATVKETEADAIVITGDISTGRRIYKDLGRFASINAPVFFVFGNHDYYGSSFEMVQGEVERAENDFPNLCFLGAGLIVTLRPGLGIIGHSGWGDGRGGLGSATNVNMNDSVLISDLAGLNRAELFQKLNSLGDESANAIRDAAKIAVARHDHILILTHVPPYEKACLYQGSPTGPAYLPHFANIALGEALTQLVSEHPNRDFTLLSGHTHTKCDFRAAPNFWVRVAAAEYGKPQIADILHF